MFILTLCVAAFTDAHASYSVPSINGKRILKESDESALHIQEKLFKELGVKLTSTEEFLDKIAMEAVERKTGARGLNNVVDDATWEAYNEVYTHPNEYSEVILTKDTADNPKKYILKK